MTYKYFDIHSHLNFEKFDVDREELIAEMQEKGIGTITVGTNLATSQEAIELAGQHEHLYATVGVHPCSYINGFDDEFMRLVKNKRVVAVGECGLDYFHEHTTESEKLQKELFEHHIQLSLEHDLPLMIHMRPTQGNMDAYEDGLDILESHARKVGDKLKGNSHFFVGTEAIAKRFLNLGFTCSFDGPITFTEEYNDVIRYMPSDMIHAETDAPFAAPEPYRGKRNQPLYVREVVKALAHIRGEEEETLRMQLLANSTRMFGV